MNKNLAQYDAEDFVLEVSFQNWVLERGSASSSLWEQYLLQNPHQADTIQLARELVLALNQMHYVEPDPDMASTLWQRIQASVQVLPEEVAYESAMA
jgi:hypothetical protein